MSGGSKVQGLKISSVSNGDYDMENLFSGGKGEVYINVEDQDADNKIDNEQMYIGVCFDKGGCHDLKTDDDPKKFYYKKYSKEAEGLIRGFRKNLLGNVFIAAANFNSGKILALKSRNRDTVLCSTTDHRGKERAHVLAKENDHRIGIDSDNDGDVDIWVYYDYDAGDKIIISALQFTDMSGVDVFLSDTWAGAKVYLEQFGKVANIKAKAAQFQETRPSVKVKSVKPKTKKSKKGQGTMLFRVSDSSYTIKNPIVGGGGSLYIDVDDKNDNNRIDDDELGVSGVHFHEGWDTGFYRFEDQADAFRDIKLNYRKEIEGLIKGFGKSLPDEIETATDNFNKGKVESLERVNDVGDKPENSDGWYWMCINDDKRDLIQIKYTYSLTGDIIIDYLSFDDSSGVDVNLSKSWIGSRPYLKRFGTFADIRAKAAEYMKANKVKDSERYSDFFCNNYTTCLKDFKGDIDGVISIAADKFNKGKVDKLESEFNINHGYYISVKSDDDSYKVWFYYSASGDIVITDLILPHPLPKMSILSGSLSRTSEKSQKKKISEILNKFGAAFDIQGKINQYQNSKKSK